MSVLKGFFLGVAYWLVVLALIVTGWERDDLRLVAVGAALILIFLISWRRVWRRRRRGSVSRRVPIPRAVRQEVYERDRYHCVYCGRGGRSLRLTIDHVFPVALGGTNDIGNLVTACRPCNLTKGARAMNDAGLRRYANERRAWASRARRRGCLIRMLVAAGAVAAASGLIWFLM